MKRKDRNWAGGALVGREDESGGGRAGGRRVLWGHKAMRRQAGRGFTILEAVALLVVVVVFVGLMLPAIGGPRRTCCSRQVKDSTQVRGITQALIVWANNNQNSYPLPSQLDLKNTTIGEHGKAKDTTGNIFSVLVFNSSISPEICVSPAEVSSKVEIKSDYEYVAPKAAVLPMDALWDPSFRGTPEDAGRVMGFEVESLRGNGPGHQSYGHVVPIGSRLEQWKDNFNASQAIVGNRGPTYVKGDYGASPQGAKWTLMDDVLGTKSNTLRIHGGRNTWEGNIAYNDGSVSFETQAVPAGGKTLYTRGKGKVAEQVADNLFVNESDEEGGDVKAGRLERGRNAYLRATWRLTAEGTAGVWRD